MPRLKFGKVHGRFAASIVDQAAWSLGFFSFNLALVISQNPDDYAKTAVSTAVAIILLAVARTWTVDSAVLFSRAPKPSETFTPYIVAAIASMSVVLLWLAFTGVNGTISIYVLLGAAMVFGDRLRYSLLISYDVKGALYRSTFYGLVGLASLAVARLSHPEVIVLMWSAVLIIVALGPRSSFAARSDITAAGQRSVVTIEAAYSMLASQALLLGFSILAESEDVAAYRAAYAIGLAPAALIIQALSTQILQSMATRRASSEGITLAVRWGLFTASILAPVSVFAFLFLRQTESPTLAGASRYIFALGFLIACQSISNSLFIPFRYTTRVWFAHVHRVVLFSTDAAFPVLGLLLLGLDGARAGLLCAGGCRLLHSVVIYVMMRRHVLQPTSSSLASL